MKNSLLRVLGTSSVLILSIVLLAAGPAAASNLALQDTPQPTPTAGADGRILYTVLAGESPWSIAAKFGFDLIALQNLNNWTDDEILVEGQTILLGLANQQEPTATPGPQDQVAATNTPQAAGTGSICVLLFDDVNGDALRNATEFGIADGQASINERSGKASRTSATVSAVDEEGEPVRTCFDELPLGDYTVSIALPTGYNPTTARDRQLQITRGGEVQTVNFGAQASGDPAGSGFLSLQQGNRSPLVGLLGVLLLLGGAGLGFYTLQLSRRR
ncbi:MAG: LysM peptidoglycan-binding domain-containing protein [Anaerolineales bacterium]